MPAAIFFSSGFTGNIFHKKGHDQCTTDHFKTCVHFDAPAKGAGYKSEEDYLYWKKFPPNQAKMKGKQTKLLFDSA